MEEGINTWVLLDRAQQREAADAVVHPRLQLWPPYAEALASQDSSVGASRRGRLHSRNTIAVLSGEAGADNGAAAPPPDKAWIASVLGDWLLVLYREVGGPVEPLLGCVRRVLDDDAQKPVEERQYHFSLNLPALHTATVAVAAERLAPTVLATYEHVLDKMQDYYCAKNPLRRLMCDSWVWWWTGPPDIIYPLALECFVEQPSPCCAAASAAGSLNMLLRRPRTNYVDNSADTPETTAAASRVEVLPLQKVQSRQRTTTATAVSVGSGLTRRNSSGRGTSQTVALTQASHRSVSVGVKFDPAHSAALAKYSPFQAVDAVCIMDRELIVMTLKSALLAGLDLSYQQVEDAANEAAEGMSPGGTFYFPPPTHKTQQRATLEGIRDVLIAMDTKDRPLFEKLHWTESGGRPTCGVAMKNVYLFVRDVWGLGKLRCHKPSTARFGSWGVQMVVEKLSEKFSLNLSSATQCLTDYTWPEFRQLLARSGVAVVLHLPNHYAVVFGVKGNCVVTARKGQPPTDLIAWEELHGIQSKRNEGMLIVSYPTHTPPPLKYFSKMTTSFSGGPAHPAPTAPKSGSNASGGKFAPATGGYTGGGGGASTKRTFTPTPAPPGANRRAVQSPKSAAKAAKVHPRPRRPSANPPLVF
eukprot:TRINITY_DN25253_c0_g1_i1.p1 TRINITY_DN25253_c0_g1~~TRINITY_DN25253_c0_g1_i1.p1  ORF type:complete len:654 (+),score=197.61 TRINITY_DN25253_c0_g1_i1:37-1962(+)